MLSNFLLRLRLFPQSRRPADHDITVKGGKYLEAYAHADTIVFVKTGTLTNAEPKLEKVISFSDYSEEEILKIALVLRNISLTALRMPL